MTSCKGKETLLPWVGLKDLVVDEENDESNSRILQVYRSATVYMKFFLFPLFFSLQNSFYYQS